MPDTEVEEQNEITNPLTDARLAFIGCGVMAEAIIAGLLRKQLVTAEQIVGSHPRAARREELYTKYAVRMFENNRDATLAAHPEPSSETETAGALVILAVKPQRLNKVLQELKGAIHPDQLVVSIVAGARTETIAGELLHPAIVRAMPNTPAQIGQGMTAWTATPAVSDAQERQVCAMLEALTDTLLTSEFMCRMCDERRCPDERCPVERAEPAPLHRRGAGYDFEKPR